jgi:hypothetical protein
MRGVRLGRGTGLVVYRWELSVRSPAVSETVAVRVPRGVRAATQVQRALRDCGQPASVEVLAEISRAKNALQNQLAVDAKSSRPFEMPDYDRVSFDATRNAVLELGRHLGSFDHAFGSKDEVDPVHHLIATAAGWGGLPDREARYIRTSCRHVQAHRPRRAGRRLLVYLALQRRRVLPANDRGTYSVNSITATPNDDGSVTVRFAGCGDSQPNCLPIMEGWNYTIRLYRPRPEVLDGSWTFPVIEPV